MTEYRNLPIGFELKNGENIFVIGEVLGTGGFGITYKATDKTLRRTVAIKEYFPGEFAGRGHTKTVVPTSANLQEIFEWGKERFLDEAKMLATFDHPNILGVTGILEQNGTAYIIMPFIEGETLSERYKRKLLSQEEADEMMFKLCQALEVVHGKEVLHRDIKPSNIVLANGGDRPVLIDFGSARSALGKKSNTLTSIVSAPFSPREQYTTSLPQSEATDIYALCATFYRAVIGSGPGESVARDDDQELPKLDKAVAEKKLAKPFVEGLKKGLAYKSVDRYQTIPELRDHLFLPEKSLKPAEEKKKAKVKPAPKEPPMKPESTGGNPKKTMSAYFPISKLYWIMVGLSSAGIITYAATLRLSPVDLVSMSGLIVVFLLTFFLAVRNEVRLPSVTWVLATFSCFFIVVAIISTWGITPVFHALIYGLIAILSLVFYLPSKNAIHAILLGFQFFALSILATMLIQVAYNFGGDSLPILAIGILAPIYFALVINKFTLLRKARMIKNDKKIKLGSKKKIVLAYILSIFMFVVLWFFVAMSPFTRHAVLINLGLANETIVKRYAYVSKNIPRTTQITGELSRCLVSDPSYCENVERRCSESNKQYENVYCAVAMQARWRWGPFGRIASLFN